MTGGSSSNSPIVILSDEGPIDLFGLSPQPLSSVSIVGGARESRRSGTGGGCALEAMHAEVFVDVDLL